MIVEEGDLAEEVSTHTIGRKTIGVRIPYFDGGAYLRASRYCSLRRFWGGQRFTAPGHVGKHTGWISLYKNEELRGQMRPHRTTHERHAS